MQERNFLVTVEVDRLIAATKGGRNAARDRCLLVLMFRHGPTPPEKLVPPMITAEIASNSNMLPRLGDAPFSREASMMPANADSVVMMQ